MSDSYERIRKALFEQFQALAQAGVTHLPRLELPLRLDQPPPMPVSAGSGNSREELLRDESSFRATPLATKALAAKASSQELPRKGTNSRGDGLFAPVPEPGTFTAKDLLKPYGPQAAPGTKPSALQVIQTEVQGCQKCPELAQSRHRTVFGVGNPNARLCFLGEAPGADEDLRGEPFVGAAGQLLDKILLACKLRREDVYILNTLKCRPPMNRTPSDQEVGNCWHFADRQLELIQPEFICCLGAVAAKSLLKTTQSISALRGTFHAYRGSRVIVTYHPAYLLRTPSAKRHVWDDMKMLMTEMGVSL